MARAAAKELKVAKDPLMNECVGSPACGGRAHWVESSENAFRAIERADGITDLVPILWKCPVARGEQTKLAPSTKQIQRAEIKAADKAADREIKDEALTRKWGPTRKVTKRLGGGSTTTEQVELECGHQRAATKGVEAVRCMKCRKG